MFRQLTRTQIIVDVAIAVFCLLLRSTMQVDLPSFAFILLMATALAVRRLSPGLALGLAWAGAIVQMVMGFPPDASNLAILAVLYATARYGDPTVKWAGLISAGVGALVATIYLVVGAYGITGIPQLSVASTATLVGSLAVLGLSWTSGQLARMWRGTRDARAEQRSAVRAVVVEQERNRIARDMHDVVAHSLAVVIAQADGARYARATDPGAVDEALTTISSTAREALADVRLLLAQLRHSQDGGPQPVLADIDRLFEQLRGSGLPVEFHQSGSPVTLPTSQQLAVYRIVQEALTNALRHGEPGAQATVLFAWSTDALDLTVTNAAVEHPEPSASLGHGIAGMRERAVLVGGTLAATRAEDRFVVTAHVPARAEVTT